MTTNFRNPRPGLYAMVLLGTIASCENLDRSKEIQKQIENVSPNTEYVSANTIGDESLNEGYFMVNGQRAYISIDGLPVEQYVAKQNTLEAQLK